LRAIVRVGQGHAESALPVKERKTERRIRKK